MQSPEFGKDVYCSQDPNDLPLVEIGPLSREIYASYSGPDSGLAYGFENKAVDDQIAGARNWNVKEQKAYGICISLYEQHPVNGKMSGDPVADAFAICTRGNNCVMLIADGVNWGEKARLAARCALYGSMEYINHRIFIASRQPSTTYDVFGILRKSFDKAHKEILDREGGLTTLCACMVCPIQKSRHFVVCCLNVGDSYGYIFSHNQGIREITQGSHDVSIVRDIRDAGGAIGPVDGVNPELHNLTYALSYAHQGDIVFLTTDGISDNYDPVVTKIAVAKLDNSNTKQTSETPISEEATDSEKPAMNPTERHIYAMKEMERIVHEHELATEEQCSAQEFCSAMVQHVLLLTDQKRKVLENPDLYKHKRLSQRDKQKRDSEIVSKMSEAPGKLDHASIVAYEVGLMRPDADKMDSIPLEITPAPDSRSVVKNTTSPSTSSKHIRPKQFFNKLRNNLHLGSSPNSPTAENSPGSSHVYSPKKNSHAETSAQSPTRPCRADNQSSKYQDYHYQRSPMSPMPASPNVPAGSRLPVPGPIPFCKSIAFESAV